MNAVNAPGLVIFDCDGVLVDSEPISLAVTLEVLEAAGVPLDPREGYARLLGRSTASVVDWLRDAHGVALTAAHLADLRARLYGRLRRELAPIPGVADAVSAMTSPVCVASSSQPDRIRLSLCVTGLLDLFQPRIFSASMVARGKPAPDLFLHAAAELGIAPADCVVVEDSPVGIRAAHAAGMRVIGFTGGSHAGAAGLMEAVANAAPSAIISDMSELPALIAAGA